MRRAPGQSGASVRGARSAARGGFTLVEIVFALALVVALLGGMAGLSLRVLERRAQARVWMRSQAVAEQVISCLDRDLGMCTIGDAVSGPGVAGNATSIRVLSRGVTESAGDLAITEIRFDPSARTVRAPRGVGGPGAAAGEGAGTADWSELGSGLGSNTGSGVEAIRLLYRDKDQWVEEFDSLSSSRLPLAVQVEIWFGPAAGAKVSGGSVVMEGEAPKASVPARAPDRVRVIAIPDGGSDGVADSAGAVGGGA